MCIAEKRVVDVLINNAAVMCCPKTLTDEGFEWQFGVNYLGKICKNTLSIFHPTDTLSLGKSKNIQICMQCIMSM